MPFTKEEAKEFNDAGLWKHMSPRMRADFQLREDLLCMPFEVFQDSVSEALGRAVYTHEFGDQRRLLAELNNERYKDLMHVAEWLINLRQTADRNGDQLGVAYCSVLADALEKQISWEVENPDCG